MVSSGCRQVCQTYSASVTGITEPPLGLEFVEVCRHVLGRATFVSCQRGIMSCCVVSCRVTFGERGV